MKKISKGTLLKPAGIAMLVFLCVTLNNAIAVAQISESTRSFEEYHLVFPISHLSGDYEGDLCIILKKDQQSMDQLNDLSFTIINPSGRIAHAKITGLTKHTFDLMGNLAGYPVGLLEFTTNGFDIERINVMLGVRGKNYSSEQIGSVRSIDNFDTKYHALQNFIKQQYPENMQFSISANLIEIPDLNSEFIFTEVEYFDPEEYRKAGDHALHRTPFLFAASRKGQINRLNLEDDLLSDIYTVTDLNADGRVELLVRTSTGFDGTYEIRLLKKDGLSQSKTKLYKWGH